jgi:hypothetical protein
LAFHLQIEIQPVNRGPQILITLSRWLAGIALLAAQIPSNAPKTQEAILVEVRIDPECHGLDCPPIPVPFDGYLCFRINDDYYLGTYRPWGFPWAPPDKKLLTLKGETVKILINKERIDMKAPLRINLKRIPNQRGSCTPRVEMVAF